MLNALIVDDEAPARQRLRRLLEPLETSGRLQVTEEAADGVEALEHLTAHQIDIMFLDVQMPELGGFDVLERVEPSHRPVVVFTTAYDAYALRAFEVNAVDYLLKPIAKERLHEAVRRAEHVRHLPEQQRLSDDRLDRLMDWIEAQEAAPQETAPSSQNYLEQISVPYRERILLIPVEQLVSAEITESITRLYVQDEAASGSKARLHPHIVSYTLDQLEAHLDPNRFQRVHRSALVQLSHIREMIPWFSGRYKLILTGDHEVIASRERSKILKDRLML